MVGFMSPISSRNIVPPSATSKRPLRAASAPVNAPFSWPNSSLSSNSRRDRAAIDGNEGSGTSRRTVVNRAGDDFLAGARFAEDQNVTVKLRHLADQTVYQSDGFRGPGWQCCAIRRMPVGFKDAGVADRHIHSRPISHVVLRTSSGGAQIRSGVMARDGFTSQDDCAVRSAVVPVWGLLSSASQFGPLARPARCHGPCGHRQYPAGGAEMPASESRLRFHPTGRGI